VTLALRSDGLSNVKINEAGEICDLRNTLGNTWGTPRKPRGPSYSLLEIYAVETTILSSETDKIESIVSLPDQKNLGKTGVGPGVVIDEGEWHDYRSIEAYERMKVSNDWKVEILEYWKEIRKKDDHDSVLPPFHYSIWKYGLNISKRRADRFCREALDFQNPSPSSWLS